MVAERHEGSREPIFFLHLLAQLSTFLDQLQGIGNVKGGFLTPVMWPVFRWWHKHIFLVRNALSSLSVTSLNFSFFNTQLKCHFLGKTFLIAPGSNYLEL